MRLLLSLALLSLSAPAMGHEWYPRHCCWSPEAAPAGRRGDCDEIPARAVQERKDGYHITLQPGDHPMVSRPLSVIVPYSMEQVAPTGGYHICFNHMMGVRCFFAGSRGS